MSVGRKKAGCSGPVKVCPQGLDIDLATQSERLRLLGEELPEIKRDVKQVLQAVNGLTLTIATLPKWENLNAVSGQVAELQTAKNTAVGGWKVLTLVFTVIGTLVGWIVSLLSSGTAARTADVVHSVTK
jgi:hypothetical protein